MPTECALRPVINAAREAAQTGVAWKSVNRSPSAARLSKFGVIAGPPNAPTWPKPMSSPIMSRMLGAPSGALTACGQSGVESSRRVAILPLNTGSGNGKIVRSTLCACAVVQSSAVTLSVDNALTVRLYRLPDFIGYLQNCTGSGHWPKSLNRHHLVAWHMFAQEPMHVPQGPLSDGREQIHSMRPAFHPVVYSCHIKVA